MTSLRSILMVGLLLALTVSHGAAQRARATTDIAAADDSVSALLMREGTRHETAHVVLWVALGALSQAEASAFAAELDGGVSALTALLGGGLDREHYRDDVVQVFVSGGIGVSHVFAGYAHPRFDKPYLFLNAGKVRDGSAPYLHELAHILAWRFGSHSLREGFATYLALEVSAAGVGRSGGLFGVTDRAAADSLGRALLDTPGGRAALPWIGRGGYADESVTSPENPEARAAYYVLGQSYARFLVERLGMPAFRRVLEAEDTDAALAATGRSAEEWRNAWLVSLTSPAAE